MIRNFLLALIVLISPHPAHASSYVQFSTGAGLQTRTFSQRNTMPEFSLVAGTTTEVPGLRAEVEIAHQANDGGLIKDLASVTLSANLVYDLPSPIPLPLKPYVFVGAGQLYAYGPGSEPGRVYNLFYQAGGGIYYRLNPALDIGVRYKRIQSDTPVRSNNDALAFYRLNVYEVTFSHRF